MNSFPLRKFTAVSFCKISLKVLLLRLLLGSLLFAVVCDAWLFLLLAISPQTSQWSVNSCAIDQSVTPFLGWRRVCLLQKSQQEFKNSRGVPPPSPDSENIHGITGLSKNVGSGWRAWEPFFFSHILVFVDRLLCWAIFESNTAGTEIKNIRMGRIEGRSRYVTLPWSKNFWRSTNRCLANIYCRKKNKKKKVDTESLFRNIFQIQKFLSMATWRHTSFYLATFIIVY